MSETQTPLNNPMPAIDALALECQDRLDAAEKDYQASLTRIAELEALTTPQPIETAPKDGTWILLSKTGWSRWLDAYWDEEKTEWYCRYGQNQKANIDDQRYQGCTHWLPMPPAPEVKTRKAIKKVGRWKEITVWDDGSIRVECLGGLDMLDLTKKQWAQLVKELAKLGVSMPAQEVK